MSNISTVYDTVLTTLGTLLPSKTRIPNGYDITENNIHYFRDGYGLKLGSAAPLESEYCNFRLENEFTVVLTKEVYKTDSQTSQTDTAVKALREEVVTLQKDFLNHTLAQQIYDI